MPDMRDLSVSILGSADMGNLGSADMGNLGSADMGNDDLVDRSFGPCLESGLSEPSFGFRCPFDGLDVYEAVKVALASGVPLFALEEYADWLGYK